MKAPNWLSTRIGRLSAFFLLSVTKGIPFGFTSQVIVKQMAKIGMNEKQIGLYASSLTWPWSFSWLIGPVVDLFYSNRLGKRRMWLLIGQVMMAVTLMAASFIDLAQGLTIFIVAILIHNVFCAISGVSTNALAIGYLSEKERGMANGLMSAGAYLGPILGSSAIFWLMHMGYISFSSSYKWVVVALLAITASVTVFLKEKPAEEQDTHGESALHRFITRVKKYLGDAYGAFTETRAAGFGVLFALLPPGASLFALAFATTFSEKVLKMSDNEYAWYSACSAVVPGVFCILGGSLSDRFGRRFMMAISILGVIIPTAFFAGVLFYFGISKPDDLANVKLSEQQLLNLDIIFWVTSMVYLALQTIGYAVQLAIFMDITSPVVAATQFSAYTALVNFSRSYYQIIVGVLSDWIGFSGTLLFDCAFGTLSLIPLAFIVKTVVAGGKSEDSSDEGNDGDLGVAPADAG